MGIRVDVGLAVPVIVGVGAGVVEAGAMQAASDATRSRIMTRSKSAFCLDWMFISNPP